MSRLFIDIVVHLLASIIWLLLNLLPPAVAMWLLDLCWPHWTDDVRRAQRNSRVL